MNFGDGVDQTSDSFAFPKHSRYQRPFKSTRFAESSRNISSWRVKIKVDLKICFKISIDFFENFHRWSTSPTTVNAYYSDSTNSISMKFKYNSTNCFLNDRHSLFKTNRCSFPGGHFAKSLFRKRTFGVSLELHKLKET